MAVVFVQETENKLLSIAKIEDSNGRAETENKLLSIAKIEDSNGRAETENKLLSIAKIEDSNGRAETENKLLSIAKIEDSNGRAKTENKLLSIAKIEDSNGRAETENKLLSIAKKDSNGRVKYCCLQELLSDPTDVTGQTDTRTSCRDHIHEPTVGAAFTTLFGDTKGPERGDHLQSTEGFLGYPLPC